MTKETKISVTARNAAADGVVDLVDGGAGPGTIEVRTGAPPATPATADSGTLLAVLTFADPAFGAASAGVATANAIVDDSSANATGKAGHFRVKDSDANVIWQGTAGITGDDVNMDFGAGATDADIVLGGTVSISSFTVTAPQDGL